MIQIPEAKYWRVIHHLDPRFATKVDNHYPRQHKHAQETLPPGFKIALYGVEEEMAWASVGSQPHIKALDGFACWRNPIFRREGNRRKVPGSILVLEALAITLFFWGHKIPNDGFHTFVDPKHVKPRETDDGEMIYGRCFYEAGFHQHPERTKERNLIRWYMTKEQLLQIEPKRPNGWKYVQMKMAI